MLFALLNAYNVNQLKAKTLKRTTEKITCKKLTKAIIIEASLCSGNEYIRMHK